MMMYIVKHS